MHSILVLFLVTTALEPELLEKIATRSEATAKFLDNARAVIEMQEAELNADGTVRTSKVTKLQVVRRDGVIVEETMLSVIIDGKEASEEERQAVLKNRRQSAEAKPASPVPFPLPFLGPEASKYRFEVLPAPASHPEWVRIRFEPRDEKMAKLFLGQALVDSQTGDVISMHLGPSQKVPFVKQMSIDVNFETMTPFGRGLSRVAVKAAVAVPFVLKKGMAATFRVLEYEPL